MEPSREDVHEFVVALFTVTHGLQQARKSGDANALALLQVVQRRGRVRPSEIAAELDIHQSSVTRQVRGLEDAGHVQLAVDPDDRRSCFISLTESGVAEVQRLTDYGMDRFAGFLTGWDADEVREFTRLLAKFQQTTAEYARRVPRNTGRRWQQD